MVTLESVSPTFASCTDFIPRLTQPTWPAPIEFKAYGFRGLISSIVCTVNFEPLAADTSSVPLCREPPSTCCVWEGGHRSHAELGRSVQ